MHGGTHGARRTDLPSGSVGPPVLAPTAVAGSAEEPGARAVDTADRQLSPPPRAGCALDPEASPRNPLDLVFDAVLALADSRGEPVSVAQLTAEVAQAGLNAPMVQEALENWQSLELLRLDPHAGVVHVERERIQALGQGPTEGLWASTAPALRRPRVAKPEPPP